MSNAAVNMAFGDNRPLIGITMGDPAGIGPEITVKAFAYGNLHQQCRPLVIGDAKVLQQACEMVGVQLEIHAVNAPGEGFYQKGLIDVLDLDNVDLSRMKWGSVSSASGRASLEYINYAIDLALQKKIDAVTTNPIHKESIHAAGSSHIGHTELFASRTAAKEYAMMLISGSLRVVHVSTHLALKKAINAIKKEKIHTVICLAYEAMQQLGIPSPRIAVSGLNPHAGEGNLLGSEEIQEIAPAVQQAQQEGLGVEGPLPPDTVFAKALGGHFDVVVAMYHDQGHIPVKLNGFQWDEQQGRWTKLDGVNVTLGLPIVRTSVDHGTAFDIVGKGIAIPDSLISSILIAKQLAVNRKDGN